MNDKERAVVEAGVDFHKSWNGQRSTDTVIRNLLRSVNIYLATRKFQKPEPSYPSIDIGVKGDGQTGKLNHPFQLGEITVEEFGVYKENGVTVWVIRDKQTPTMKVADGLRWKSPEIEPIKQVPPDTSIILCGKVNESSPGLTNNKWTGNKQ